jgi:hypothetical protein
MSSIDPLLTKNNRVSFRLIGVFLKVTGDYLTS